MAKPYHRDAAQGGSLWSSRQGEGQAGEFDLALNFAQKAVVKAAMRSAGAEKEVRSTLRELCRLGFFAFGARAA